jgi:trk system potassium uptake protein TrkH
MPNFRPVLFVVGMMLVALAIAMLIPAMASHADVQGLRFPFLVASGATIFVGGSALIVGWDRRSSINVREGFLATALSWTLASVAAAMPLYMSGQVDFTDAMFEAMSGLTTTGSSIFPSVENLPAGVLIWRSIISWIGGIGIIAVAIMIMPFLRVGGMQLFRAESSERAQKITARPLQLSLYLFWVYFVLTVVCGFVFWGLGMSPFDAINHAMGVVATGGYSTHDASFGYFQGNTIKWVAIFFMILGSLPFVLYIKALRGDLGAFVRDQQVRGYLFIMAVSTVLIATWLWNASMPFGDALTHAAFNVTSIISTAGYASADYILWGTFPAGIFLILSVFGGCTGSTAGGMKIFRIQIIWQVAREQMRKLVLPSIYYARTFNEEPVSDEVVRSVIAFIFAYIAGTGLLAAGLSAFGLDLVTSLSGAATAIANVGPGLGPIIGPYGNFSSLPDGAKWILIVGMLLGRLEFFTILVIFTRTFWRA